MGKHFYAFFMRDPKLEAIERFIRPKFQES